MIGIYQHRDSYLHRAPAALKLLVLLIAGTLLFFVHSLALLALTLLVVLSLYRVAGLSNRVLWQQFYAVAWLLVLVFAGQLVFNHWTYGAAVVLRLSALILLAALITLTTRSSAMIDIIVRILQPLSLLGFRTDRIGLMLMLTIRYIPMLFQHFTELRDAQCARCCQPGTVSLVVPLLVRALQLADQLAEAIDARAFDTQGVDYQAVDHHSGDDQPH